MTPAIADRARSVRPDDPQGKTALRIFSILGPSCEEPPYHILEGEALFADKVN